ncbi:hypothetical protein [Streptomyces dysideae]|uniref:DUF4386 domain-containing protein n=1 Tax=Streptomyces dysideae TaxID=909626 RepID=A0A101UP89_9ACTN|nr:hypothetical protein [Streptomyces dysideae]KUO14339.1 hypothetical protein AQJ91_47340 [Streptomyces dysideae]
MRAAGGLSEALGTPRIAGAVGIVSALLLGIVMVLIRNALPADPTDATGWLTDSSRRDALQVALGLLPFAGIFFLWFMGAVRNYVGEAEDKFFATLFLGGGLLFVALFFVFAAVVGGLLATADTSQAASPPQLWQYGRHLTLTLLSGYCTRMAAVFTLSTTMIGHRLGIFPRWLAWLGYLAALVLLFVRVAYSELVFPVWILAVSGHILRTALRPQRPQAPPVTPYRTGGPPK